MKGFKPFPYLVLALYMCVLTACGSSHPPNGPGALFVSQKTVPDGVVQSPYNVTLGTIGGQAPFTWSLKSGTLPPGLTLTPGGVISGTPPLSDLDASGNAKTYSFVVKVVDSQTPTAAYNMSSFTITINPLPLVTTTSLPDGIIGVSYNSTLTNSGGLTPFTWTVTTGTLPAGLSLGAGTGTISGVPTGPSGDFPITVQVTDADSNTATAALSITIKGKFEGNFAFTFNGFDNGQPFYTTGSFIGDGGGNITSGFIDQNGLAGQDVMVKVPLTGTYNIATGNLGSLTFTIAGVTYQYQLAVALNGDVKFILADTAHPNVYGSGVIKSQAISQLGQTQQMGLAALAGNWTLGFFGVDNGGKRSAGAGSIKVDASGNLTRGIEDTNDNGTVNSQVALTGSWALDSDFTTTGRGTITLTAGANALNYAFYVVNPKTELIALQTDAVSSGASLSLVSILQSVANITGGTGFSNGSLTSSGAVFQLNGISSTGPDVQLGVGQFDGVGHIALYQTDENKGGTYIPASPLTGFYSVDTTTGRVTIAGLGTGSQPVWYLAGGNRGFVIATDASVTEGSFEPQSNGPFSLPSFLIGYAGGTIQPGLPSVTNELDSTVIPPPGGTMQVTYDTAGGPGSPPPPPLLNQMSSYTYVLGDDPTGSGTNTTGKLLLKAVGSTPTNSCMCTAIVYMITGPSGTGPTTDRSNAKWASINIATPAPAAPPDPNPRLTVVQSTFK